MRRVSGLVSLWTVLLAACGQDSERSPEMQEYLEAVELQNSGSLESALASYKHLLQQCDDRNIRAKAELGQAQIESAFESKDRALTQLREVTAQIDHRSLRAVQEQITGIVTGFMETPFEDEIRGAAQAARMRAVELDGQRRQVETGVARNLIERGQFGAAMEYLRELESGRLANDRRDIAEALASLRLESDRSAEQLLTEFESLGKQNLDQAAGLLDEQMPRFVGTRAHARLLEARLQIASTVPLKRSEPGNETPEDGQQR